MRVALLSYKAPAHDAVGNHVAEQVVFFLERGAQVQVFLQSPERLHPDVRPHAQVVARVEKKSPAWNYLAGADLVIAHYGHYYDLFHFLPLLAGEKPRLLLDYVGITPPELWEKSKRELLEAGLRNLGLVWCTDAAVAHSLFTRAELIRKTGFPSERIYQIGFPIDGDKFSPCPPKETANFFQKKIGLSSAQILLFVGRLAPNKRVQVLVEALALLQDIHPPIHVVAIGDDRDVYAQEAQRCRELAGRLGMNDRLHILGQVDDNSLVQAYRSADVLVMPSVHEGFCIPVLEAMACGLPVVAARSTALPETVAGAGLTFTPDDPEDLAQQIRRVLFSQRGAELCLAANDPSQDAECGATKRKLRIALVCFRFGADIVGGAETSLRTLGTALQNSGHEVEVFTTCARAEGDWNDDVPPGTLIQDGFTLHRFPLDPHDRGKHLFSVQTILESEGQVSPHQEEEYLRHSIHSSALIDRLRQKLDSFHAVIVGPYLFGLTWDVARNFPEKTLLLPCFHDEPLAGLQIWKKDYRRVAGILYHSPEEKELAQTRLGINHPAGSIIGTYLKQKRCQESFFLPPLKPSAADPPPPDEPRYLVYCGRFSRQKDLPRLLEFAARYHREHPGQFKFVFMGEGEVAIPKETWALNLGRVEEETKHRVLAGAAALIQLSRQESLSLAALEAWGQGTPIIADRRCAVLHGQIQRSGGGRTIVDYPDFAQVLNDLWIQPKAWRKMGENGQRYVQGQYASQTDYVLKLERAIGGISIPIREHMRERGLERAAGFARPVWRESFGRIVESVLHQEPGNPEEKLSIEPLKDNILIGAKSRTLWLPVRIHNQGNLLALAEGPARTVLCCQLRTESGAVVSENEISLPGPIMPGRCQIAAAPVRVAQVAGKRPGKFQVFFRSKRMDKICWQECGGPVNLAVADPHDDRAQPATSPFMDVVHEALAEIHRHKRLPDDYLDVTEGWFARWKRWIKQKLLGNFKRGYVDVLSRQQSRVNQHVFTAVQQLADCCATLDHALQTLQDRVDRLDEEQEINRPFKPAGESSSLRDPSWSNQS